MDEGLIPGTELFVSRAGIGACFSHLPRGQVTLRGSPNPAAGPSLEASPLLPIYRHVHGQLPSLSRAHMHVLEGDFVSVFKWLKKCPTPTAPVTRVFTIRFPH